MATISRRLRRAWRQMKEIRAIADNPAARRLRNDYVAMEKTG
jgi:hypothetical protein